MVYACFRLKNGKTMHSFCKEHNLSYSVAVYCIECGMSPDEAVEKAMKVKGKRGHNNLKYMYNGITLREYCRQNNLCYSVMLGKMRKK